MHDECGQALGLHNLQNWVVRIELRKIKGNDVYIYLKKSSNLLASDA